MLNKVCLIVNYNLYESKRHFTRKLAEALNRFGIETRIIDVNEQTLTSETVHSIKKYAPDLTCSFNSLLPISEERYLWDYLQIPHWAILVDPALYSIQLSKSPFTIFSSVDRTDVAYIKSTPFENAFFFPHAVEKELEAPNGNRTYEVVFFGSCYDYESLRVSWKQRNTEAVNKVLDDAIDIVFSDNRTSLAEALVKAWNVSKLDPSGVDFITLFYYLDNYTRGKDRVELIKSVKDAQVHVFGELSKDNAVGILGWTPYVGKQKNVTLHPSIPFWECLNVLKQTKVCLNSMPFFKNGTHERVLIGLACGAVPITTENLYFQENFKSEEELYFYSMQQRGNINEIVNDLISNEAKRSKIAAQGRQKVMGEHTWDKRVEALLKELPPIFDRMESLP